MLNKQRRVILMRPFGLPGIRTPGYADWIAACGEATDRVGERLGVPVIAVTCNDFTEDGLLPSESGYQEIAGQLADLLVGLGGDGAERGAVVQDETLANMILAKDELFFHRHRPQNETYLLLFRKHEQGNNAVELPQFDPLIEQMEQSIWERAARLTQGTADRPAK
jgi:hypothetical protein